MLLSASHSPFLPPLTFFLVSVYICLFPLSVCGYNMAKTSEQNIFFSLFFFHYEAVTHLVQKLSASLSQLSSLLLFHLPVTLILSHNNRQCSLGVTIWPHFTKSLQPIETMISQFIIWATGLIMVCLAVILYFICLYSLAILMCLCCHVGLLYFIHVYCLAVLHILFILNSLNV